MGTGTATVLIQCRASRWKRQPSARLVESAFHDIVWWFYGFLQSYFPYKYELDDVLAQCSVSSRRPSFSSFMTLPTRRLGECYDGPYGLPYLLPFLHNLTSSCCVTVNQSAG